MTKREHVFIAVPAVDYRVTTHIAQLFAESQKLNHTQGKFLFSVYTVGGIKFGVDLARNTIAREFLKHPELDRLWMIDADINPEMDVFGILDVDADIVSPLMPVYKFKLGEGKFQYELAWAAGDFEDINDTSTLKAPEFSFGEVADVSMVGTGCMAIRRHVLEDKQMWYPGAVEGEPPPIFRYQRKANGECESGEDFDFCIRAKRLGYSVKLHGGIEVGHMRDTDILHIMKIRQHCSERKEALAM